MVSRRGLEGGRGLYQGDEAFIDQGESFQGRRPPAQNGQYISTLPPYTPTANSLHTANRLLLIATPIQERDVVVEVARIRVTTLSVGQNVRTAVFAYDTASQTFFRLPGSDALFSTTTTGLKEVALVRAVRLVAGRPYFIAFKGSDGTAGSASSLSLSGEQSVIARLRAALGAGELPTDIKLSAMTSDQPIGLPSVVYLSALWKDVL